jgi:hypothetical protein
MPLEELIKWLIVIVIIIVILVVLLRIVGLYFILPISFGSHQELYLTSLEHPLTFWSTPAISHSAG